MSTNKVKTSQKLSKLRRSDPFFERESQKYDFPLPSREFVIQILADHGVPLRFADLADAMDIHPSELQFFERRMFAMERDGQVMRNRNGAYLLPAKADLIRGRVQGHPDGYGFVVTDDEGPDIFLGPNEMREVLHGDRVIVRVAGLDRRGRPEGKIVEVLERANTRLVGRVLVENGVTLVVPENRRISQEVLLEPGSKAKLKPVAGQVVVVELVEQPTRYAQPIGRIVEVLGNYADPGMEIEIALRKHELPFEFSAAAKEQTRRLPEKVRKMDWKGRVDLTALPLVTIDGETARDFDDAVFCEREGRGFRLVVAIADVSHYVTVGSALDGEGYDRGNSVYFPRRVIPMLPEKLSNGLCSLNPQVERLCMVCDMAISQTGAIKQFRFYPAVMFSKARLTYNQVAAALYDKDAAALEVIGELLPHLQNLDKLFRVLLKARAKRGAIDFETQETRMIFDDNGKIANIVAESRNDAHRLIEECMLAANVCASEFLQTHEHPVLYRVHEGPTPEKLAKLRDFLGEFGLQLGGGEAPKAADYARLLEKIQDRPDLQLLQTVMLRSLRQAVYSPDNAGHFGLAYDAYTHFTSPIRRYPDLAGLYNAGGANFALCDVLRRQRPRDVVFIGHELTERTTAALREGIMHVVLDQAPEAQARHAAALGKGTGQPITVAATVDPGRSTTEVLVSAPDRPGLFADLCGALSAIGANIVAAHLYEAGDDRVLDVFDVQDSRGQPLGSDHAHALDRLLADLRVAAAGGDGVKRPGKAPAASRRHAAFIISPTVLIDRTASTDSTVI